MSEKVRRQKDIIVNATQSYENATTAYQDYLDSTSQIQITYFQISDEASRTDSSLETTHEIVGHESSIYYNRIKNVPARGTSGLDIMTQLTQRGVESFITGEFVLTPDVNINPRSGELFAYEDNTNSGVGDHLFEITDVQYDRATNNKYYKCSFKLYPKDVDEVTSQIYKKYVYDPDGKGNSDGVGNSTLITEEESAQRDAINNMVDGLIDTYTNLFYNGAMDTFTYQRAVDNSGNNFEYYWSPYVCHFIYKNNILAKTKQDFLTEIYIQDYNENNYPALYNERGYRKSIFYSVEANDPKIIDPITASFMEVSVYDLNKPLNLPFFSSADKYYLVEPKHEYNRDFWLGAFNWVFDNEQTPYMNINGNYKYTGNIADYLQTTDFIESDGTINNPSAFLGKQFYKLNAAGDQFNISEIWSVNGDTNATSDNLIYKSDLYEILNATTTVIESKNYLIGIIRDYFSNTLVLSDSLLKSINDYYYDNSFKTYMLLPMIIYILQQYDKYE